MAKKYTNISLPDELIKEIDNVVKQNPLGYKNRADLCKEAIRCLLRELAHYGHLKKSRNTLKNRKDGGEI